MDGRCLYSKKKKKIKIAEPVFYEVRERERAREFTIDLLTCSLKCRSAGKMHCLGSQGISSRARVEEENSKGFEE